MNKTLSIGLAGFSFMIEEHAYIKLSDYLAALRNSLDANEADEVMHDIEIRMVEIFKDSLGKREVINDGDVEKVISQIGKPEVIEEQEEAYFSEKTTKAKPFSSASQKQLFRDPENAKLGGVCAGLANYFGMNITTMRLIWVVIAILGIFSAHISTFLLLLIYIIMWIVLPKAESAADFLKMKGKPLNFDNLKQESNKIVQFANESTHKVGEMYNESKPFVQQTGNGLWNVVRVLLGGICGLIGVSLLFSALAIFGAGFNTDFINLPGNFEFYLQDGYLKYLGIAFAFLTVFIPALLFIFLSIKLLSPKTKLNYTGYVFGALVLGWFVLLGMLGLKAFKYKTQYTGDNEETANVAINTTKDTLLVDLKKVVIPQNFKPYGDDVFSDLKTVYEEEYPSLDVTRKDGSFAPYLVIKKEANGYNQPLKLEVPVEVQDNKILLPNYVSYPYEYRLRRYHTSYELVVPKNKKVLPVKEENGFSINVDQAEEDNSNSVPETDSTSTANTVKISADNDYVTVNGKKVTEAEADRLLEEADKKAFKDITINVNNGKKEITIKTK